MSQTAAPIRVLLIDDHRHILWGLERLIETATPAMCVVGSVTSATEALAVLATAAPDVIVLDLDLGRESGLEALPQLTAASAAKVLVLTGVRDSSMLDMAVMAGARGVVGKEAPVETLLTAIARVHEGQLWLDRAATGRVFLELSRGRGRSAADPEHAKIHSLTARECQIVEVIARNAGGNASSIAEALHISEHTLRNHLTSIYAKLGVANRLELYAYAHKHGLVKRG